MWIVVEAMMLLYVCGQRSNDLGKSRRKERAIVNHVNIATLRVTISTRRGT